MMTRYTVLMHNEKLLKENPLIEKLRLGILLTESAYMSSYEAFLRYCESHNAEQHSEVYK